MPLEKMVFGVRRGVRMLLPMREGSPKSILLVLGVILGLCCAFHAHAQDGFLCADESVIAKLDTPGKVESVFVDNDRLYVADWAGGLHIFDASDPQRPMLLGTLPPVQYAEHVVAAGSYAYVSDSSGVFQVIDVSEPASPQVAGELAMPSSVSSMEIRGTEVFIAATAGGLLIVDIADPHVPRIETVIPAVDSTRDMCIIGTTAYVAESEAGLVIYDISDLHSPVELGRYDPAGSVLNVDVEANTAFVPVGDTLIALDVSDPDAVVPLGEYATVMNIQDVVAVNSVVYIVGHALRIISMENPAEPELLGFVGLSQFTGTLFVDGQYVFVGDAFAGVYVVDIPGAPASPLIGSLAVEDATVLSVHIIGDVAYVLGGSLQLFDVSSPETPVLINTIETWARTTHMVVRGDIAYLADASIGVWVLDVSNPRAPTAIGVEDNPRGAQALALQGDYLYVAAASHGMRVLDITIPDAPRRVGEVGSASRGVYGIAAHGDTVCLADSRDGMQVVDVSNPEAPTIVATVDVYNIVNDVLMVGDLVYMYTGQLFVYDVTNPYEPQRVTRLSIDATTDGKLSRYDDMLFIGGGRSGVFAIDTGMPADPRFKAWYPSPDYLFRATPHADVLYVANNREGVLVLSNATCRMCVADWDHNMVVDTRDVVAFLNAWVSGDETADLTGDGMINTMDVIAFLNAWAVGCN